jgi:Tfp pilus assembly protein PilE
MNRLFVSKQKFGGFAFVELIIYIALLTAFSVVIVESIIGFSDSYRRLRASKLVSDSAAISFERITREIRDAHDFDLAGSVLNSNVGRLKLVAADLGGDAYFTTFALENGVVEVYENDVYKGPLTSKSASTTSLVFKVLEGVRTKAVHIEMSITATSGPHVRSENFSDTVILRGTI